MATRKYLLINLKGANKPGPLQFIMIHGAQILVVCSPRRPFFFRWHLLFVSHQYEVFPCFFLSYKASARVKPRKDGARPALFLIFVLLYVYFVLFYVLFVL